MSTTTRKTETNQQITMDRFGRKERYFGAIWFLRISDLLSKKLKKKITVLSTSFFIR